jgi:hypothetical protein
MSWKVTIALVIFLVTVGLYAWFDAAPNFFELAQDTPPEQEVPRLITFASEEITAIQLRRDDVEVRIQRKGGTWEGVDRPQRLDDFLLNIQTMGKLMVLDVTPEELQDYGLSRPSGRIELQCQSKSPIIILLGDRNPAGTGAYVQLGTGQPVTLTGALLLWEFEKALKAVRESTAGNRPTLEAR